MINRRVKWWPSNVPLLSYCAGPINPTNQWPNNTHTETVDSPMTAGTRPGLIYTESCRLSPLLLCYCRRRLYFKLNHPTVTVLLSACLPAHPLRFMSHNPGEQENLVRSFETVDFTTCCFCIPHPQEHNLSERFIS